MGFNSGFKGLKIITANLESTLSQITHNTHIWQARRNLRKRWGKAYNCDSTTYMTAARQTLQPLNSLHI